MAQFPETFFSTIPPSLDILYVKSSLDGVDLFYSVNRIYGLKRVASIAKKNLQPMLVDSVRNFLSEEVRVNIHNNLLFILDEYAKALYKIANAVSAVLYKNSGERQALTFNNLSWGVCEGITELNLSGFDIKVLPPQIKLFKNLQKLNLSGNDLKFLPIELKCLPLIEINVQGNNWLQPNLPKWIDQIASVTLPNGSKLDQKNTNNLHLFQVNSTL